MRAPFCLSGFRREFRYADVKGDKGMKKTLKVAVAVLVAAVAVVAFWAGTKYEPGPKGWEVEFAHNVSWALDESCSVHTNVVQPGQCSDVLDSWRVCLDGKQVFYVQKHHSGQSFHLLIRILLGQCLL